MLKAALVVLLVASAAARLISASEPEPDQPLYLQLETPPAPAPGAQLGLFTEYVSHPVVDALRTLDLDTLSPMQAFDALRELKRSVEDE